nr:MmcB family DNA repair protein [Polymorphobacter sp.]
MASVPELASPSELAPVASTAQDVARGVSRLLWHAGIAPLTEVPLGNGRRADVVGIGSDGLITLVEIKVALGDLRGDGKWPEYLDYCDRYYWAVPPGFPLDDFDSAWFQPERAGLIIADRWDAAIVRPAAWVKLSGARRKAETLRFGRRAAQRLLWLGDPGANEGLRLP